MGVGVSDTSQFAYVVVEKCVEGAKLKLQHYGLHHHFRMGGFGDEHLERSLGLDLRGGSSFLVGLDTSKLSTNAERSVVLGNAIEVLRKRVDRLGVAEPMLQPSGDDRILIQLPGLSQAEMDSAKRAIEKAAFLEFRMVHPESAELLSQGIVEPGYEVLREEIKGPKNTKEVMPYLVKKGAERGLTGKHIKRASVSRNHVTNDPEIQFEMDSVGAATSEYRLDDQGAIRQLDRLHRGRWPLGVRW